MINYKDDDADEDEDATYFASGCPLSGTSAAADPTGTDRVRSDVATSVR